MDHAEIKLAAQFKILLAKVSGAKMDLVRFSNDAVYAKEVLEQAATSDNEALLVVTLQLMQRRGLIEGGSDGPKPPSGDRVNEKYVGRLR